MSGYVSEQVQGRYYRMGRDARDHGETLAACRLTSETSELRQKRAWWLAGHHDRDIELAGRASALSRPSERQLAKQKGETRYVSHCEVHGETLRWVASTKCVVCEKDARKSSMPKILAGLPNRIETRTPQKGA